MTTCSEACIDERMTGTASHAAFWLAVEQRGPWGKKAFVESHLDPQLGKALEDACKSAGGRALLIRGIDGHADTPGPRRVLLSGGPSERPWLLAATVDDPAVLLDLPFDGLTGEAPDLEGFAPCDPQVLVCTNGKRDVCCSKLGRPVVNGLYLRRPEQTWEATHLSGHRFAPTVLMLPTRQMLGRVSADVVEQALDAAARGDLLVDPDHDRGRTDLSPMLQAAETFLRAERGVAGLGGLRLEQTGESTVRGTVDGRVLDLTMAQKMLPANPASCGIEAKARPSWGVLSCQNADASGPAGQKSE